MPRKNKVEELYTDPKNSRQSTNFRGVQICYCPLKIKKKMAGTKFFDQLDLKHNKKQMDFFSIGFRFFDPGNIRKIESGESLFC